MEDLKSSPAARPGTAILRHGRLTEGGRLLDDGEDVVIPLKDPESATASPLTKSLEVQQSSPVPQTSKPGFRSRLHRALVRDNIAWPCLRMSPRLQGLVLLNLVRINNNIWTHLYHASALTQKHDNVHYLRSLFCR